MIFKGLGKGMSHLPGSDDQEGMYTMTLNR
jgi:hypothetical protein